MSRAFITDKEDWAYCAKAGERCMHAEPGRDCRRTQCEHYDAQPEGPAGGDSLTVVRRRKADKGAREKDPGEAAARGKKPAEAAAVKKSSAGAADRRVGSGATIGKRSAAGAADRRVGNGAMTGKKSAGGAAADGTESARATKRSKLAMPRKWGGRSGNTGHGRNR
jgi:hypothetical protein